MEMSENQKSSDKALEFNSTKKVEINELMLDCNNPRFGFDKMVDKSDAVIIAKLYVSEDLAELLQSISKSGYIDFESLIAYYEPKFKKYIVLEGNRRLAALRLFREPELLQEVNKILRFSIDLPEISNENLQTLKEVSIYLVENRESARPFIGFKHINGPAKWNSYAKALFAADWHKKGIATVDEIANKIGDRNLTVKKMITAIYVIDQAENEKIYSISNRSDKRFSFSHLYTALSRSDFMNFLKLQINWQNYEPEVNPIPEDRHSELRELLVWLYGSKNDLVDSVIRSQNPDLKMLGETIISQEGINLLRNGKSLEEAHQSTKHLGEELTTSLIGARTNITAAYRSLRGYNGFDHSLIDIADDTVRITRDVKHNLESKYKEENKNEQWDFISHRAT